MMNLLKEKMRPALIQNNALSAFASKIKETGEGTLHKIKETGEGTLHKIKETGEGIGGGIK